MDIIKSTSQLFGNLWPEFSSEQFEESILLWNKRAIANNFDLNYIRGKRCLDVGCGSGRYSHALARNGAEEIIAIDISENGIAEAKKRAIGLPQIKFQVASALNIPYPDCHFDFVVCAGVLHHTTDFDQGLSELFRVCKPDGKVYLLVYGTGGIRWTAISALRPIVAHLGINTLHAGMKKAKLPANNRKNFLDDLFVPIQIFSDKKQFEHKLKQAGFVNLDFWENATFDHEGSLKSQLNELIKLNKLLLFSKDFAQTNSDLRFAELAIEVSASFLQYGKKVIDDDKLTPHDKHNFMIGTGNIRVIATKENP